MVHFVNDKCIKCKYTDCVEVCPVDCFHEGEEMLVIDPEVCIDCGVCVPECPIDAIMNDDTFIDGKNLEEILHIQDEQKLTDDQRTATQLCKINSTLAPTLPVITQKKEPLPDAEIFKDQPGKVQYLKNN